MLCTKNKILVNPRNKKNINAIMMKVHNKMLVKSIEDEYFCWFALQRIATAKLMNIGTDRTPAQPLMGRFLDL